MKQVYVNALMARTQLVKAALEMEGIAAVVRNEAYAAVFVSCWPEVWICNDEDYERAMAIVQDVVAAFQRSGDRERTR